MAIPKKGSRRITINEVVYRWRVRKEPTYGQSYAVWNGCVGDMTFSVEHEENPLSVLVVHLPQAHPGINGDSALAPVTPCLVSQYVIQALDFGWQPTKPGNPFHLNVEWQQI